MAYNNNGYYGLPAPARQPLEETPTSSVPSASSTTSYATSYSTSYSTPYPTAGAQDPITSHSSRDMAYSSNGYYASPAPAGQPLAQTRSSPVSSTSSSTSYSTSYSTPYSELPTHHAAISRTLSPASGVSSPETDAVMYSRSHYQPEVFAHEHPHTSQAHHLPSLPSEYLPTPVSSSYPMYSPIPTPRQFSRPPQYAGYPVTALHHHQQPPPLSYDTYGHLYPPCATTAYHSPPPEVHQVTAPDGPKESPGLRRLRSLPPHIVAMIREYVGWFDSLNAYLANRWFRQNFHPDDFPLDMKDTGMLYAEQRYGRYHESDDAPSPKKSNGKCPPWFGCYHCFRIKTLDNFELYKWASPAKGGGGGDDASSDDAMSSMSSARRRQSHTPPSTTTTASRLLTPPTNPHYDPSLTRSMLRASSTSDHHHHHNNSNNNNNNGRSRHRRTSPDTDDAASSSSDAMMDRRAKQTYGVKRYCIDCGLKRGFYEPGDYIETHEPAKKGKDYNRKGIWVCKCRKFHELPNNVECGECRGFTPLCKRRR
ncbi:hypothetical protein C8A00DRAFT_29317 [Chaetomidium leptoderma]|uniref:Uncharacterized protein n=1 Tax=Chaetomidium leptoderma TaxID=669021 RepID=A0AAN7A1C6_9PEZI|nr:hypothetical protein C8A00DRAFT_29317 [Chaetomidium leptoderma]